jgi:hypothetical protein
MKGLYALLVALALASAACKKDDNTPTTPSAPATKTDTFTGTVQVKSSVNHTFTVEQSGQVSVTLTAASPPSTIAMGIGVGTPANGACGVLQGASVTTAAGATAQLTGVVSPGMLCVTIFDVGNQTAAVTYTVTVMHP